MELQPQREAVDGEGLMVVEFRSGQMQRAGGKIEGIPMPVKEMKSRREQRGKPCGRL